MRHDPQKEKLIVFMIDINKDNEKRSVRDRVIIVYLTAAPPGMMIQHLEYGRIGLRFRSLTARIQRGTVPAMFPTSRPMQKA
jgi:hypothetical protein